MAKGSRPIGVFDSGMGGISALRRAILALPSENFIYYGDNKNAPYGDRSFDQISELTQKATKELVKSDVKAILIACNTATAAVLETLRQELPVPVVGTEPAILSAELNLTNGVALVLATQATIKLPRYRHLREKLMKPERVIDVACSIEIAKRIEHGEITGFYDILRDELSPFDELNVESIVLGCTHYPFITDELRRYAKQHFVGNPVFFDGSVAAVKELESKLSEHLLLADEEGPQSVRFMTSGNDEHFRPIFERLLGSK